MLHNYARGLMSDVKNILDLSIADLKKAVAEVGLRPFVVTQLIEWLYQKKAPSFDVMGNVSKSNRDILKKHFLLEPMNVEKIQTAKDGTQKYLFQLPNKKNADGGCQGESQDYPLTPASVGFIPRERIEAVKIPAETSRLTICLSSQVGCGIGCSFCRTGMMGLSRNLTQAEMLGQVLEIERRCLEEKVTNLVFMGMGEPMANLKVLIPALEILTHEKGFNFSKRRITVSTSGLVPKMVEFVAQSDVKLAISLHAANNVLRDQLVPLNKKYPLKQLKQFCLDFQKAKSTRHRITFEYVMLKGVNDTESCLEETIAFLKEIRSKVNLIPFNPFPESHYQSSTEETVTHWVDRFFKAGIQTNVRHERGREILAACGQLAA